MPTRIARDTVGVFPMTFAASTTSATADLAGRYPIAIENVASGPTSLTIDVLGYDGSTWKELTDDAGVAVPVTLVASKYCLLPDSVIKGCMGREIRLVNGGSISKEPILYTGS